MPGTAASPVRLTVRVRTRRILHGGFLQFFSAGLIKGNHLAPAFPGQRKPDGSTERRLPPMNRGLRTGGICGSSISVMRSRRTDVGGIPTFRSTARVKGLSCVV